MLDGKIISTIKKNTKQVAEKMTTLETTIRNLSNNFNTWKDYWTSSRANKLDNLDKSLSGVENTINRKIDTLVSASQGSNPNLALTNLTNKVDGLKQDVATKSGQVESTVRLSARSLTDQIKTLDTKFGLVNTTITAKASQGSVDGIASNVNSVLTLAKQGTVRRVQRGEIISGAIWYNLIYTNPSSYHEELYTYTFHIPFPLERIDKSILLCSMTKKNAYRENMRTTTTGVTCELVNNSIIKIQFLKSDEFNVDQNNLNLSRHPSFIINWQLIEFY